MANYKSSYTGEQIDAAIAKANDALQKNKVKTSNSTTAGDVYDVTYINSVVGNIETLLGGI